jgi:hypothetical protein
MKWTLLIKYTRFIAVSLSLWTMTFAPVALGQESQKISEARLQQAVKGLGLHKSMTLGQFWDQNKYLMPDRLKKQIEPYINANRNQMMPTFEVVSGKSSTGEMIPSLRVTSGGELINIQWHGDTNRYIKFQNTNLSEIDLINFSDMYSRILAGDEKYRKQIEQKPVNRLNQKFKYASITEQQWKTMPNYAKAQYIVNLRLIWQDAREVLKFKEEKTKNSSDYFYEKYRPFFELFRSNAAEASARAAKSCVVAGYISKYENGACSVNYVRNHYAKKTKDPKENLFNLADKRIKEGNAPGCNTKALACNPYIYGAPGGNPICVTPSRTDEQFQKATHFDGPCDTKSRLQSNDKPPINLFKNPACAEKSTGRYNDECLRSDEEIKSELKSDQNTKKLTEDFLLGILKLQGKTNETDFSKLNLSDPEIRKTLMDTKKKFEDEINEAQNACKEVSREGGVVEKNYWLACDQLFRRFLFIDIAITENCEQNGQQPNPAQGGCSCLRAPAENPPVISQPPAPSTPPQEIPPAVTAPGAMCPNPAIIPAPINPPPAKPPILPQCDTSSQITDPDSCICAGGNKPHMDDSSGNYTCNTSNSVIPDNTNRKGKEECGVLCSVWKGVKVVAPFAIAGLAAFFLFKWMAPKKPSLAAPPDKCPNGSLPPCAQTCEIPLMLQPTGECSCGCGPGQYPDSKCNCQTGGGGGSNTNTILCPDATTRAANLDACPDYPCWWDQEKTKNNKDPQKCSLPIGSEPAPASPSATPSGVSK